MKVLQNTFGLICAVFLTACNAEVFIDDFLPDPPEIMLTEGKASVDFEAENWGILWISKSNLVSSFSVRITILDPEGTPLPQSLPLDEGKLAVVSVQTEFHDFTIEKRNARRLDLIPGENMEDDPVRYLIEVGNGYERKTISAVFPPSRKYQVDSVVYQWDTFSWSDYILEPVQTVKVDNSASSQPTTVFVHPYRDASRKVTCVFDEGRMEQTFEKIFGKNKTEMTIPDLVDGKPVFGSTKVFFEKESQELDAGMDRELEVPVGIEAGDRREVCVFVCVESYSVPFKVYASHPETGKKRVFSGVLYSKRPFDYLVLRKKVKNDGKTES